MRVTRKHLDERVSSVKSETASALQTVYDALNNGQQKKLLKDENVKALLIRYGIVSEDGE